MKYQNEYRIIFLTAIISIFLSIFLINRYNIKSYKSHVHKDVEHL